MIALSVDGLTSGYGPTTVVDDLSFELRQGEILSILGRNGAGKTTLLKSLLNLVKPTSGSVVVLGHRVEDWPTYRIVRLGLSYGAQESAIFHDLTVGDNLAIGSREVVPSPMSPLDEVLEIFPALKSRLRQRAGTLSGGEQKMLVLARALIGSPSVVLLDEVVEGVQPSYVQRFHQIIVERHRARGTSFLVIEQNISFALSVASRYAVMQGGRLIETGVVRDATRESVERHLTL